MRRLGLVLLLALPALALAQRGPEVARLVEQLGSGDEEAKAAAIRAAAALGRAAVEPLLDAMARRGDPRRAYREAIWAIANDEALPELARLLASSDPAIRRAASTVISAYEEESLPILEALIAALDDPDPEVRENAAYTIGALDVDALPAFTKVRALLRDPVFAVRYEAATTLSVMGPPAGVAAGEISRILDEVPGAWQRKAIIESLERLATPNAEAERRLAALERTVLRDSYLARLILEALRAMNPVTPEGRSVVQRADADITALADARVRAAALDTLQERIDAIASGDPWLRRALIPALEKESVAELQRYLDHPSPAVHAALGAAFLKGNDRALPGPSLAIAIRQGDRAVREDVVSLSLAPNKLDGTALHPALIELIQSTPAADPLRDAAVEALLSVGPAGADAFPVIVEAMGHFDPAIRQYAARVLRQYQKERAPLALDALAARLADPDEDVRASVVEALEIAGAGSGRGATIAIAFLADPSEKVRRAAAIALGGIGIVDDSTLAILARLRDEDPQPGIRRLAARTLIRLATSSPRYVSIAIDELQGPEADEAERWLGSNHAISIDAVLDALASGSPATTPALIRVVSRAMSSGGSVGARLGAPHIEILEEALRGGDPDLRKRAVGIAGRVGERAIPLAPALAALAAAGDQEARRALAATAPFESLFPIAAGDEPRAAAIASEVLLGLQELSEESLIVTSDAARRARGEAQRNLLLALRIGGDRGAVLLARHIDGGNGALRRAAVRAARFELLDRAAIGGAIPRRAAAVLLPALERALTAGDAEVARAAADSIGSYFTDGAEAAPALRRALASPDAHVRIAAGRALRRVTGFSLDPLVEALRSRDAASRRGAADALGSLYSRAAAAAPDLAALLEREPDTEVRAAAIRAQRRIAIDSREEIETGPLPNPDRLDAAIEPMGGSRITPPAVVLEALVMPDGSVDGLHLLQGWDVPANRAALARAATWRFPSAAAANRPPVAVRHEVRVAVELLEVKVP